MTWTTPKTWATGEPLTASDLNTHLKDNLNALKEPATDHYECNEASDYATTSTSFVDVDASNLALTVTTTGGDILVGFHGQVSRSTTISVKFELTLDGVAVGGDDGIAGEDLYSSGSASKGLMSFVRLLTGVDAGAHTIKLQWKVNAGTATLYAGAGTTGYDMHPQFWVREVS